jgi:transposase
LHGRIGLVTSARFLESVCEPRWAGVCLAENRRSWLLVGLVITTSPPRPGAHNAIIADLAMPVVPGQRGARTWLRGVLVVGDRRTVGDPRTAVACAGQHGRPRWTTREALPPCDSGRHPVHRGGMRQLPVEFPPAGTVSAVFARWARGGAWQRILDALRDRLRVRAGRDRCPTAAIIDSQTVPAADTVPRSSRGWDGGKRTNGVKRHLAVDVNGLLLTVVVTAASIPDRDAAHRLLAALRGSFSTIGLVWADGGYLGRLLIWAKDVLTLTMRIIKCIPRASGFHVRPRIWVVDRRFAWVTKHCRCVRDYEPDHHEAMVHLAMITTMTGRLART